MVDVSDNEVRVRAVKVIASWVVILGVAGGAYSWGCWSIGGWTWVAEAFPSHIPRGGRAALLGVFFIPLLGLVLAMAVQAVIDVWDGICRDVRKELELEERDGQTKRKDGLIG